MNQEQQAAIRSTVVRLTNMLSRVASAADLGMATGLYRQVAGGPLSALNLVDILPESDQGIVQAYVEAWSDVVQQVFLNSNTEAWRELLVPKQSGFQFMELSMIAFWLGWFDSDRLSVSEVPLPPPVEQVGMFTSRTGTGHREE